MPVEARAAELHRRIGNVQYHDHLGIRGLTLNVGYLAAWGVDPKILASIQHGLDLEVESSQPKRRKNHPSCKANAELVHSEYLRSHGHGEDHVVGQDVACWFQCQPMRDDFERS